MLKRKYISLLILFFLISFALDAQNSLEKRTRAENVLANRGEVILEFIRPSQDIFRELSTFLSIDKIDSYKIQAYANRAGFMKFLTYSIPYNLIESPSLEIKLSASGKGLFTSDFNKYPTYQQYDSIMQAFAQTYPQICTLDTFGLSINGRLLLAMKISDHVDLDESEPECMYSSTMHGDETGGYVLMLRLIHYLLSNYGTDAQVTALVDSLEIWINPLANPDGTYHGGDSSVASATRFNANGIDLNRNFADPEDGPHPDGNNYQPENIAMMDFLSQHHFSVSANFHAGEEVVNYPWDTWQKRHADDNWFRFISRGYADTVHAYSSNYMIGFDNGITDGYDWYSISGGRQDYVTYFLQGRETTIELDYSKITPESQLGFLWEYNYRSLLNYIKEANYGIHGFITDSVSHLPVEASIIISGHYQDSSMVFSEVDSGFYVRLIEPGQYNLSIQAPGYEPGNIYGINVANRQQTRLDVKLKPIGTFIRFEDKPDKMQVFPNPTVDRVTIKFWVEEPQRIKASLEDISGKAQRLAFENWYNHGWHKEQVNLTGLSDGIYIICLRGGGFILRRKFIKTGGTNTPKP